MAKKKKNYDGKDADEVERRKGKRRGYLSYLSFLFSRLTASLTHSLSLLSSLVLSSHRFRSALTIP